MLDSVAGGADPGPLRRPASATPATEIPGKTRTLPFNDECFAAAAKVESERVEVTPDTSSGHIARPRRAGANLAVPIGSSLRVIRAGSYSGAMPIPGLDSAGCLRFMWNTWPFLPRRADRLNDD